jgi:leucyl/phenylalanyl-tRNA--protein transferase
MADVHAELPTAASGISTQGPVSDGRGTSLEDLKIKALCAINGVAWALKPERISAVLPTLGIVARHYLSGAPSSQLPDPETALSNPDGLVGVCGELTADRAVAAYRKGLYPWSHIGPQKWWSLEQRSTLFFENYRLEKGVRRALRQKKLRVTFDEDFSGVIKACAAPRPGRFHVTWIRPQIIEVYTELFNRGQAHSVEVWNEEGELVGGAYGLALGKVFFTESQFYRARDASKVGFAVLNRHLQHWGFAINDAKAQIAHLENLGFVEIPRATHTAITGQFANRIGRAGHWKVDPQLDVSTWQPDETEGLRQTDVMAASSADAPETGVLNTKAVRS